MKYVDPSGEWLHIVVGAVIGGVVNLATNWDNVDGFWQGVAAFGIGAVAGATTAATGGISGVGFLGIAGVATLGGAVTMGVNSVISQTGHNFSGIGNVDWGQVGISSLVGGVSGLTSYGAGQWACNNLGNAIVIGFQVNSPMFSRGITGMLGGAIGGAVGGFTGGFLFSRGDLETGLKGALSGFSIGAAISGGVGLGSGYFYAKQNCLDIWSGASIFRDDFTVTPDGIVLPKNTYIPYDLIENPYSRVGSYGKIIDGKFIEVIRIDPGTSPFYKGPNNSHFHLNGGKEHIFDINKWPWRRK